MTELQIALNAFTRIAGTDERLPEDSPASIEAKAFRELQMKTDEPVTAEEAVAVGLPNPDSQVIPQSQASDKSSNVLVYTDDASTLPEGSAGRKISAGVFEVIATYNTEPFMEVEPKKINKFAPPPREELFHLPE